jgi:hypothetical protein
MFRSGLWSTGHALIAAVDGMYKVPLNRDTTEYLAKCYLLLGDPSTHVWQDVPQAATLTGPTRINVGTGEQTFSVKIGAQPVKNAQVCVSGPLTDEVTYVTGFTDASGSVRLSIDAPADGMLAAYAWAKNIIPVEQQITVGTGIVEIVRKPANSDGSFSLKLNPFAATTTLSYSLPKSGSATLAIYSLDGALVRTVSSGMQAAGFHSVVWNGRNEHGTPAKCGVYIASLRHGNDVVRQSLTKTE